MKPAYLPLYVRDWWSDPHVRALSWTEQMVYLSLLMVSWETGPLTGTPSSLVRSIGWDLDLAQGVAVIESVLGACWDKTARGWENQRLERERTRTGELITRRSDLGKRGAASRWDRSQDANGMPTALPTASGRHAHGMPRAPEPEPEPSTSCSGLPGPNSLLPVQQLGNSASSDAPPPPAKRERKKSIEWTGAIPEPLRTPAFIAAWEGWLRYRRVEHPRHVAVTQTAGDLQLKQFAALGPERAMLAIEHTQRNQWQGIREPDAATATRPGWHRPTARERQDAELRAGLDEIRKVFHPEERRHESA